MYLSMEMHIDDGLSTSARDVPFVLYTAAGGLVHAQSANAFGVLSNAVALATGESPDVFAAAGWSTEMVWADGERDIYVRYSIIEDPAEGEEPEPWLRVSADDADDLLPNEAAGVMVTALNEFVALLDAAAHSGATFDATAGGAGEVGDVPTKIYTFVVDLAAVTAEWPRMLRLMMGTLYDPLPPEVLAALPPLPTEVGVHVDGDGFVRQVELDLDIGALGPAIGLALAEFEGKPLGDPPDGEVPEGKFLWGMRYKVLAINDPSLTVTLPSAAEVVEFDDYWW